MIAQKTVATKSHTRSTLKLYFLIMSIVGVIGTLVAFGILIFSIAKQVIITDAEYIVGNRYYEIEACSQEKYEGTTTTKPTQEEITTCEEEKKEMLIQSRKVMFKEDVIG